MRILSAIVLLSFAVLIGCNSQPNKTDSPKEQPKQEGNKVSEREPKQLFTPIKVTDLKEEEGKIYDRIRKQKTTKAIGVYLLNNLYRSAEFAGKVDIKFKLNNPPQDNEVDIPGCTSEKGIITLKKEGAVTVNITVKDGMATGLITDHKRSYAIESLGNYKVAIVQVDQTQFPKD